MEEQRKSDETLLSEIRDVNRTQIREIEVSDTDARNSSYGGGLTLRVPLGERTSTLIDLNVHEARAWGEVLIRAAEERNE